VEIGTRDRRARAGVAGAYFVQGLCFASLLTQVPALKEKFGFTDDELTLILLAVPVVAGLGSVLAGVLAPRLGSAVVLRVSGPLVCATIATIGFVGVRVGLYAAVASFGLVVGAVDASMNMQGVGVQRRYGRSLLASFHGWWSLAGILGSLATAGSTKVGLSLGVSLTVVALVGVAVAVSVGPLLLRRREEAIGAPVTDPVEPDISAARGAGARIPWRPILLVGLAVMVMYVAESATSNWSADYLHDALHASKSLAAFGLGGYLTCQLAGRLVADRVIGRVGPVRAVAAGGVLGVAGMVLVAVAPAPVPGVLGFAVVGVGLCVVVPLSFSAAGALDPTGSGVAVARVNLFNYVGFVVGAALIGAVAHGTNLRWAFGVLAVVVLAVVGLSGAFGVAARAGAAQAGPGTGAAAERAARDIAAR
jgi:sugar phosphate permease